MRHLLPLLLPALLALTPLRAQADEEPRGLVPAPMTLAVTGKTTQPTYGAPLELDVALTNHASRLLPVHCDMAAFNNPSIRLELIDKQGVVWLPAVTPEREVTTVLGDPPFPLGLSGGIAFRDNVWNVAPGKTLRFTLTLTWFRRKVPLTDMPVDKAGVPGLPAGRYTVRAEYTQKGLFVPSAKPFWNPRRIQIEPTRPMKVVPGLFQGTLWAKTLIEIHPPTTSRVDALNRRVRELERQLSQTQTLLQKLRALLNGTPRHAR